MNKLIAAGAIAALAGVASGQAGILQLDAVSGDTVLPGGTITYEVTLTAPTLGAGQTIFGWEADLISNVSGVATDPVFTASTLANYNAFDVITLPVNNVASGADISRFGGSQFPASFASGVSVLLGTFTLDVDAATPAGTFVNYSLDPFAGVSGPDTFIANLGDFGGVATGLTIENLASAGAGVEVVPTPGAAGILGLAGLAAVRRRR